MIDSQRIRELQDDFGIDDLGEIIEAFLDEAEEALTRMQDLLTAGDTDALERDLHFLKGCAGNVGARELSATCLQFEQHPEQFGNEDLSTLCGEFDKLRHAFCEMGIVSVK